MGVTCISNPKTTGLATVLLLNLILFGFGVWWNANALILFSIVVSGSMATALLVDCLKLDSLVVTVLWTVPPICGAIGVIAYRCMRICGSADERSPFPTSDELAACSSCPSGVDVTQFAWTVDVPFYLSFFNSTVQWFVSLVNFIPEGICWANLAIGLVFLVFSLWPTLKSFFSSETSSTLVPSSSIVFEPDKDARPLIPLR